VGLPVQEELVVVVLDLLAPELQEQLIPEVVAVVLNEVVLQLAEQVDQEL
jgi:hypothetical protein